MKDNFIGNKLKEISEEYESWCRNIALDALCGKYDYIKSEDWWKEKIKQSLTDYHNHIVESEHNKILNILNYWKAETDEGSQEIDKLFLHLKNYFQESLLLQDTNPKE